MTVLNPGQVAAIAKAVGWPQSKLPWVVMTTFGESSWNTGAINGPNSRGEKWYGLGQISDVHKDKFPNFFPPSQEWKDPAKNLAAMKVVYDAQGEVAYLGEPGQNSRAASVSGQATMAAAQVAQLNDPQNLLTYGGYNQSTWGVIGQWIGNLGGGIGGGSGGLSPDFSANGGQGYPDSIGKSAIDLFNGDLTKIAWVAGGGLMVILGLLLLFKSETPVGRIAGMVSK